MPTKVPMVLNQEMSVAEQMKMQECLFDRQSKHKCGGEELEENGTLFVESGADEDGKVANLTTNYKQR